MKKMVGDVRWGRKQLLKFLLKKMGEETILSFLYADARKAKLPLWGDGRVFLIRSNLIRDDGGAAVIRLKQPGEDPESVNRYVLWTGDFQEALDSLRKPYEVGFLGLHILSHLGEESPQKEYAYLRDALISAGVDPKTAGQIARRKRRKRRRSIDPGADPRQLRFFYLLEEE